AEGEDHAAPGRAGSAQELAGIKSPGAGPLIATAFATQFGRTGLDRLGRAARPRAHLGPKTRTKWHAVERDGMASAEHELLRALGRHHMRVIRKRLGRTTPL